MEHEAQGQDGNHQFDNGGGHEVATQLEPAVSVGVGHVVCRYLTKLAVEGVQDGEEINGAVKKQEDDKESARDALNELLADRRG